MKKSSILKVLAFSTLTLGLICSGLSIRKSAKEVNATENNFSYADIINCMKANQSNKLSALDIDFTLLYGDIDGTLSDLVYGENYYSTVKDNESGSMFWPWQVRHGSGNENSVIKMTATSNMKIAYNGTATSGWASGIYRMIFESGSYRKELTTSELVANGTANVNGLAYLKTGDSLYFVSDAADGIEWQTNNFEGTLNISDAFDESSYTAQKEVINSFSYADIINSMMAQESNTLSALGINYELLYGDIDGTLIELAYGVDYYSIVKDNESGSMFWPWQVRHGYGNGNGVIKMTATSNMKIGYAGTATSGWASGIYRMIFESGSYRKELTTSELVANGTADVNGLAYLKTGDSLYFVCDAADGIEWQTNNFEGTLNISNGFNENDYLTQFPKPEKASEMSLSDLIKDMINSESNKSNAINGIEARFLKGDFDNLLVDMQYAGSTLTGDGTNADQGNIVWDFQWRGGGDSDNLVLALRANQDLALSLNLDSSTTWANVLYKVVLEGNDTKFTKNETRLTAGSSPININGTYQLKQDDILYLVLDGDPGITWQTVAFDPLTSKISVSDFVSEDYENQFKYQIKWVVDDNVETQYLAYGAMPTHEDPIKEDNVMYTYTFDYWSPSIAEATSDATYTAIFNQTLRNYNISVSNEFGHLEANSATIDSISNIPYGSTISVNENTLVVNGITYSAIADDGYKFAGFSLENNSVVNGNMELVVSFTAKDNLAYTVNHYQQNILDDNYTLVSSETLYGMYNTNTNAVAKTYEGFDAKDFSQAIIGAEGNTTVDIKYDRKTFTVTWKDEDSVLETDSNVKYGATPEYNGQTPTKENDEAYSYTFNSWTPTIEPVSQNATYQATYTSTLLPLTYLSLTDVVKNYIANNGEPTDMKDLDVTMHFGDVDSDVLYDFFIHSEIEELTGLNTTNDQSIMAWPWQWRAGDGEQNIILMMTAKNDIKLELVANGSTSWAQALYRTIIQVNGKKYELKDCELNASIGRVEAGGTYYLKTGDILYFVMDEPVGIEWMTCEIEGGIYTCNEFSTGDYNSMLENAIVPEENNDVKYSDIINTIGKEKKPIDNDSYTISLYAGEVRGNLYETNVYDSFDGGYYAAYCTDGLVKENHNDGYPVYFYPWQCKSGAGNMAAIIKFTAKENLNISLSTPATKELDANGNPYDWSCQAGARYEYYIGLTDGSIKKIYAKQVVDQASKNEYATIVNLKEGESFYYSYVANWGIIVSEPVFTISSEDYDSTWTYQEIIADMEQFTYYDMVSRFIANGLKPVELDSIYYGFGYGDLYNPSYFMYYDGDGTGIPEDALCDIEPSESDGRKSNVFWRWQLRCSGEVPSFIYMEAKDDTYVDLSHDIINCSYLSNMFVNLRVMDENGILLTLKSSPINLTCDPNDYLCGVNLAKGDKLFIEFTYPNGGIYTATAAFAFDAKVIPSLYDASKRPDFNYQIELNELINEKIDSITALVNSLDFGNYSDVKWIEIEDIALTYKENIANLLDKESVIASYDECVSLINAVENKQQESENLLAYKQEKIDYITGLFVEKDYSKADASTIKELISAATNKINDAYTKAAINTAVAQFESQLAQFDKKSSSSGCKGVAIPSFISLFGLAGLLFIKKRK